MHKYRNALFIMVSLPDVVYGGMGERDCERYPCPLGGAAGFGKIWAAEMRRCAARHQDGARKYARRRTEETVVVVAAWYRRTWEERKI